MNDKQDTRRQRQQKFSEELKYWLLYVGFATAIISAIAYIIIVFVIITGFDSDYQLQSRIYFSLFSSAVGLIMSFALRSQGITFAQKENDSIEIMTEYRQLLNKKKKDKKLHDITYYMVKSTITDIIFKGLTIAGSLVGLIYFFSQGNGDWALMGLAASNILMFIGFGLIALSKAYDHYIDQHIPVIKQRIERLKNELNEPNLQVVKRDKAYTIEECD